MRRFLPLIALLLATSCGQSGGERTETKQVSQDLRTFDIAEEAPPPPPAPPPTTSMSSAPPPPESPNIGPSAAPGVAFNYRYAFRLPANRVAPVQEQHAQACERLGLARCRITGMRYRLVNERDIEGMLSFKLDPAIARAFGKAGIEAVTRAEGMLVDSEITGVDAGAAIKSANRADAQLNEDLRRVEAQLSRGGIPADERARLQSEAQQLRQMIRSTQSAREQQEESLATTPVVFQYGSGDLVPGFDTQSPLSYAAERAGENFERGLGALIVLLATVLPWALLLLLAVLLLRRFGPNLTQRRKTEDETPPA